MDEFTTAMRLCDDDGMVSAQPIRDGHEQEEWSTDSTYLERLNRLRRMGARARGERSDPVTEAFQCTGHAHLAGEHIRCTSRAHNSHAALTSSCLSIPVGGSGQIVLPPDIAG